MKIQLKQAYSFYQLGSRSNQEDARYPDSDKPEMKAPFFVVCDGVGGSDKGEVASGTVCRSFARSLENFDFSKEFTEADFDRVLAQAYADLEAVATDENRDMATTLTFVAFHAKGCFIAHIGDSRVYYVRKDKGIVYRTEDHSLVNALVKNGCITEEEALTHPDRNVITRAMGVKQGDKDYAKATLHNVSNVQPGDYVFLCSDGVLKNVTDQSIIDILSSVASDEEKRALQEWIAASEGHAALYEEIRKDFKEGRRRRLYTREEVEMQLAKFHRRNRNRKLWLIRRVGYAAAVVLVVGVAFCVSLYMKQPAEKMAAVEVTSVPEAGAQLILSSGELVDLDDRQEFAEENVRITRQHKELTYLNQDTVREREVRYNTLVIPRGGDFKVTLADGTIVWLNSCTRLRYPLDFKGDVREVFLEGEAYFEVAKDAKHPFVVRTADVDVRVLGTRFNLSAYEDDALVSTTLEEGSVEVSTPLGKQVIRPNEQLVFNVKEGKVDCRDVDASVYSAWKDGMFVFEDETLERIMKRLQMWYDVEVFFSSEDVKSCRFTGDLKRYDDFSRIVRMIEEVAGVSIQINGNCIIIGTK